MNQKSFLKSILTIGVVAVFAAVFAFSNGAFANEEKAAVAKPDVAKGEALYTNGDTSRNIIACMSCHGAAGNSTISQNPKLAGQHAAYLAKQLHDFTGPTRNNAVMTMIAKSVTPEDIGNISEFLSKQKPKMGAAKNKDLMELGKKIYRAGLPSIHVPACAGCHGPKGSGIPAQYPRLAGQHQDYTIQQLNNFNTGARTNSDQMNAISHRMRSDEIKAVADYIAGLE